MSEFQSSKGLLSHPLQCSLAFRLLTDPLLRFAFLPCLSDSYFRQHLKKHVNVCAEFNWIGLRLGSSGKSSLCT